MPEEKREQLIKSAKDKLEKITSNETFLNSKPFSKMDEDMECEMDSCPFGDPSETKSFWVQ